MVFDSCCAASVVRLLVQLGVRHGAQLDQIALQLLQALPDLGVGPGQRGEGLFHLGDEEGQPLPGQSRLLAVALDGLGVQVDGAPVAG